MMYCSANEPCHCYGRICLVGGPDCSQGNVFFDARPVCGTSSGWMKNDVGKTVCKELGFKDVIDVTNKGE